MTPGRLIISLILFATLEIIIISSVAGAIGWPWTLLLLLLTALVGTAIVRRQGVENWKRFNQRLQSGELPGQEAADSVMLLIGSILLILPGFITDTLGIFLLIPGIRHKLSAHLIGKIQVQGVHSGQRTGFFYSNQQFYTSGNVYEGEAKVQRDHKSANDPDSNVIELPRPPSDET